MVEGRTVHIVGGGLAGLTAAWEIGKVEEDTRIRVYERLGRFGGKAGSNPARFWTDGGELSRDEGEPAGGARSDHGYHLFPDWYRNVIELMGEVGVDYDDVKIAGERFTRSLRDPTVMATPPRPLQNGEAREMRRMKRWIVGERLDPKRSEQTNYLQVGPRRNIGWVILVAAHLASMPDSKLRDLSMSEYFDRHQPFLGSRASTTFQTLFLKAFSADERHMSALSVAKFFRHWTSPISGAWGANWTSLDGSLERRFIAPLADRVRARPPTDLFENTEITGLEFAGDRVSKIRLRGPAGNVSDESIGQDDVVILAVPPDVLARLVEPHEALRRPAEALAKMTTRFSGVDVHFRDRQLLPREHFGFVGEVAATAYNVAPIWSDEELAPPRSTVLQIVIPESNRFDPGDGGDAEGELVARVREILDGICDTTRAEFVVNVNEESKLSLANKGSHRLVEELASNPVSNLHVAGDFMPTSIGVPSMEAAVGSGRRVARGVTGEGPGDPDTPPHGAVRLIGLFARIFELVPGRRPDPESASCAD